MLKQFEELLAEYDYYAQQWGWECDQGSGKHVDIVRALYLKSKETLTDYVEDIIKKSIVPEGFKLVPIDPTEKMIQAACLNQQTDKTYDNYEDWWNSHSSAISARIRNYLKDDYSAMVESYKGEL